MRCSHSYRRSTVSCWSRQLVFPHSSKLSNATNTCNRQRSYGLFLIRRRKPPPTHIIIDFYPVLKTQYSVGKTYPKFCCCRSLAFSLSASLIAVEFPINVKSRDKENIILL